MTMELNIIFLDEAENDNRRSIMADGRSEISNASGNSRRPTMDSNMSRERSYISRDINLLIAPPGGTFALYPHLQLRHRNIFHQFE